MPAACERGLPGTNIQPPDQAVAPPQTASFSTTMTFNPCQAAVTAADSPPAPDPTTSTSHSTSRDQALADCSDTDVSPTLESYITTPIDHVGSHSVVGQFT